MSLLDKCGEIVHDCALRIERMTLRPHSLSEIEIELRCLLEGLAPAASLESKAAAWDTISAKLTQLTGSEDWLVDFDKNGTQCAVAVIERFANPLHTIDMLLFCPRCQKQHIDAADTKEEYTNRLHESSWWESGGEKPARWMNPPHATHTCRYCGLLWRPSNANTNGVENIPALENKHVARIIASSPAIRDVPVARHHRCHDACALAVEVVMDALATECPRCKGTGKIMQRSFSEPRQDIEKSCHICKGTGKIGVDSSPESAQKPHGYLWFNKHMEQRFTHNLPHPQSSEQPIGEAVPVYLGPASSINAPLIWLYSHCRAIGMTDKSHSGKPEEDIALFTVQLKAAAERSAMDPFVRSEIKRIAGLIEEYLPKEMNAEGAAFNLALTRGEWRSILCGLKHE